MYFVAKLTNTAGTWYGYGHTADAATDNAIAEATPVDGYAVVTVYKESEDGSVQVGESTTIYH